MVILSHKIVFKFKLQFLSVEENEFKSSLTAEPRHTGATVDAYARLMMRIKRAATS